MSPIQLLCTLLVAPAAGAQVFENVAPAMGIDGEVAFEGAGITGGAAWLDADGDGDLDLVTVTDHTTPALFAQAGGVLVPVLSALPPLAPPQPSGVAVVDIEGDGDPDLLLLRTGPDVLLRNDGGAFTDVSATHLPGGVGWSVSAAVGDLDADGDDDLVIGEYIDVGHFPVHHCAPNRVLINDGTGRFEDAAATLGTDAVRGCTLAIALTDYDNDGDLDIAEINDFGSFVAPNALHRNDGPLPGGGWSFVEVGEASGFDVRLYGMGVATSDVNDDGWLDYYVTSIGRQTLLLGGPGGTFADVTDVYGVGIPYDATGYEVTWTPVLEDLDGDGWLDLFVTGGRIPAAYWIKNGEVVPSLLVAGAPNPPWLLDPSGFGLADPDGNNARGVAVADFDADGRPDLAVRHAHGLLALYQNQGGAVPLRVRLTPTVTGPSAAGARVIGTCGGFTRHRELTGGGPFGSAHAREVRLTFPEPCDLVEVTIRWPSGHVQVTTAVPGGLIDAVEPTWLAVEEDTITVAPTSSLGEALPADAEVEIVADGAAVGATLPAGPGEWQASWAPDPGAAEARFTVRIDGQPLPAHPTRRLQWPAVRSSPQRVVAGQPFDLIADAPVGQQVSVTIGGAPFSATDLGDGTHRVAGLTAPPTGPLEVGVTVAGVPAGTQSIPVAPPWDPSRSLMRLDRLYLTPDQKLSEDFRVSLDLFDVNGRPVNAEALSIEASLNGQALPEVKPLAQGEQVLITFPAALLASGDEVGVTIAGVPYGSPQTFRLYDDPEDLAAWVDPAASICGLSMSSMPANGGDVGVMTLYLRDARGNPLPVGAAAPVLVLSHGMTVVPGSAMFANGRYQARIRAGTEVGAGLIEVRLGDQPTGVTCAVALTSPPPMDPSAAASTLAVDAEAAPIESGIVQVTVHPRGPDGRLVGGGLDLALETTLGTVTKPLIHYLAGEYRGTIQAGAESGVAVVTASSVDPPWSMSVEVNFFDPDPPPEPPPDTGTVEDAGAAPDVPHVVDAPDVPDVPVPLDVPDEPDTADSAEPSDIVEPDAAPDAVAPPDIEEAPDTPEGIDAPAPDVAEPAPPPGGDLSPLPVEHDPLSIDVSAGTYAVDGGCQAARTPSGAPLWLLLLLLGLFVLNKRSVSG